MRTRGLFLVGVVAALGCSDIAGALSGSCSGTQAVAGRTVNVCTESPSLTVDNQATLNAACRSGQLGTAASSWSQGDACPGASRVGGCRRAVQGVDVVSWVYASPGLDSNGVRAFCAQLGAAYQSP